MSASASAAACPATSASVTAARNVTVTHKRAGDVLPALYSSNVLEWGFCEVRIHGVPRSSLTSCADPLLHLSWQEACKTLRASTNRPLAGSLFGIHDRLRACQTNAPSTTRTPVSAEYASTLVSSGSSTAGPSNPPTR